MAVIIILISVIYIGASGVLYFSGFRYIGYHIRAHSNELIFSDYRKADAGTFIGKMAETWLFSPGVSCYKKFIGVKKITDDLGVISDFVESRKAIGDSGNEYYGFSYGYPVILEIIWSKRPNCKLTTKENGKWVVKSEQ